MNIKKMQIKQLIMCLLAVGGLILPSQTYAHINPNREANAPTRSQRDQIEFRNNCDNATQQIDMDINNVRARLTTGGDVWWNGNDGRYIVPKAPPGVPEISSIFAGAVWLGGRDPGGGLKVAAQQYGRSMGNGEFDYYPGPLTDEGTTSRDTCGRWDKFFTVSGENIRQVRADFSEALETGGTLSPADIPEDVLGWPASGNPFFFDIHDFELPTTNQGLAGFWDQDLDGIYDPTQGDYPIIEIRNCVIPQFPEEMTFWIYNDAGNIHRESNTVTQIRMEVQVQAFAYTTADDINNMTFQRYKLINRAEEDILDTYFAMWVDPDLGCFTDDYVGCDTTRSLAYVYNQDELDGTNGCVCEQGVNTYCDEIPILGVDYFRGPRAPIETDTGIIEIELGMSSFIYMNNAGSGGPPPGTTDPNTAQEYYNYLQGIWRDGTPLCDSGDGYDEATCNETRFVFPDAPNDGAGFSMSTSDLPFGDRRTLQASGPFTLQPGAVNELIIGVVWVPDQTYPDPSIRRLQQADDLAQDLFDSCFDICDGPDAPDVDVLELDREIVLLLSNRQSFNNFNESYTEKGLGIPTGEDSLYRFEGYRVFQLANASATLAEIGNIDRVREIATFDLKNGVTNIFDWNAVSEDDNPLPEPLLTPELQVRGQDNGIRRSLSITTDAFSFGEETNLVNNRRYYFAVIAYAYNNYKDFDPLDRDNPGQTQQYKASSRNIGDELTGADSYEVIPRPTLDQTLRAEYGDTYPITRLAGRGNNGNFLDMNAETREEIEEAFAAGSEFEGEITYDVGAGPIDVFVSNPLLVRDGEYEIKFFDESNNGRSLDEDAGWMLRCLDGCDTETIVSERSINELNEQLIREYGFSIIVNNVPEPGEDVSRDEQNGAIGGAISYADPDGDRWLNFLPDGLSPNTGNIVLDRNLFNYVSTGMLEEFESLDPNQAYDDLLPGVYPFRLMDWRRRLDMVPFYSPVWLGESNPMESVNRLSLDQLNNVDIVFTSDKSLWSRCPVIETASFYLDGLTINGEQQTADIPQMFDTRDASSVTREADADDNPIIDENIGEDLERGMGWFPGYAVDVETGERLAVFFGENSTYAGQPYSNDPDDGNVPDIGNDLIFNPSSDIQIQPAENSFPGFVHSFIGGGQHFFYVTDQPYDDGENLESRLEPRRTLGRKVAAVETITWAGFPLLSQGSELLSYADGLIPNDVTLKLRVDSEFDYAPGVEEAGDSYPTYQFTIGEAESIAELDEPAVNRALDMINVVPNPYYAFSEYENGPNDVDIQITNLPGRSIVTIYSLDGKFIRKLDRDESPAMLRVADDRPFGQRQIRPSLSWDMRNFRGIPVSSGVYLIHVDAPGLGERTLKFFGIQREFDPSGF